MNKQETHAFLTYINQNDPRIEPSPYAVSIWQEQLADFTPNQADAAYRNFIYQSDDKPTARKIRLACQSLIETDRVRKSAMHITRDTAKISFAEWKARNPGLAERCWRDGVAMQAGPEEAATRIAPAWAVGEGSVVASVGSRI